MNTITPDFDHEIYGTEESRDLPVAFVPHWKTFPNAGDFRHKGGWEH